MLEDLQARLLSRLIPADRVAIIALLARAANHHRTERPAESWQMLFEDYAEALEGISEGHLRDVIAKCHEEINFFPKIAELTSRWKTLHHVESEKLRRARIALGTEAPKPWERAQ